MRCHEARNRIASGESNDRELATHLLNCTACAEYAEAERKLVTSLDTMKSDANAASTPLSVLRRRIETQAEPQRKDIGIMSSIFNQIRVHPRLSVGLVMAVAVFLFATLVPFDYQRLSGYEAVISYTNGKTIAGKDLKAAMEAIGHEGVKAKLEMTDQGSTYSLSGFDNQLAAREAVVAMNALVGEKGKSEIKPVYETVSGSLYAQARASFVTIEINGEGKTDAQLEAEIADKLARNGLGGANVSVSTGADGYRKIDISRNSATPGDTSQLQVNLNLAPGATGSIMKFEADSTMTDAEVKAMIEDKLRAQGVVNPQVTVTTDANGKRNIEIKAEKL